MNEVSTRDIYGYSSGTKFWIHRRECKSCEEKSSGEEGLEDFYMRALSVPERLYVKHDARASREHISKRDAQRGATRANHALRATNWTHFISQHIRRTWTHGTRTGDRQPPRVRPDLLAQQRVQVRPALRDADRGMVEQLRHALLLRDAAQRRGGTVICDAVRTRGGLGLGGDEDADYDIELARGTLERVCERFGDPLDGACEKSMRL